MANIKDLKKDIKQMVKHLLDECYTQLAYSEPISTEWFLDIISDIQVLEKDTLRIIKQKSYERGKSINVDYQQIANEFYDKVLEIAERINSIEY
ncbi:hypothetical protein [Tenuifilum thalassicum]|uniref:Uncharacterized protein n=1 Tax=Tenuifilum thalassicum TaxID=2590900 RepID=A0A7D3XE77_9BACT|nr:hypothetical protein [Tenuifilum thalassicum]QKG80092.1 hypothetical protein FHG85_07400 [Tenuifilum thalassicum]